MLEVLVKSSACLIPGLLDSLDGELISTHEILDNIKLKNFDGLESDYIRDRVGIESVSFFKSTADFVRSSWASDEFGAAVFASAQSTQNSGLYNSRKKVAKTCLNRLKSIDSDFTEDSIVAHIHVSGPFSPALEYELFEMRQSVGIGRLEQMQSIIFQQGCSGLFTALDCARRLLSTYPNGSNVLITAEQNMQIYAHERCNRNAEESNIDEWLWGAIFGEGVGALVVGTPGKAEKRSSSKKVFFRLDSMKTEIAEPESRVTHVWKTAERRTSVLIKAREVRRTYLKHIAKHAAAAIDDCGGLDSIFRVCLHESNPKLLSAMQTELSIPKGLIPTVSAKAGTLACVSAFSTLDIAMSEFHQLALESSTLPQQRKIAMALIGEAAGNIVAGSLCLTANEY